MNASQFYYVMRVGPGHPGPTKKHSTIQAARAESERLALLNPGDEFEILQYMGTTRTKHVHTEWAKGYTPPQSDYRLEPNIPF